VTPDSVLCSDPRDGDLTFTVHADDAHAAAAVTITARPGDPFVELAPADNSDSVRLLPRPTYDFGIGTATVVGHTLAGQVDRYTLRATLGAVPAGLDGVTVEVTGALVADGQVDGCAKVDDTHLSCTGMGSSRTADLAVTSTATERHAVTLTVRPPAGYADPDGSDDSTAVTVGPAVDLRLASPTPAVPVRSTSDTYDVTTVLSGVRSGPVAFTVSGAAAVTDASCAVDSPTRVTCADPTEGQAVRFTLHPDHPAASTSVSITAHAADVFEELAAGDNTVATTLTPDVSLDSLTVLRHRDGNSQAVVAAQVSGVPAGVTSVRVRLSGPAVGLGAGQVHLTDGQEGADAEGLVTCTTTDATGTRLADGVYATCTRVDEAVDGHFQIVMRVAHPHGTPSVVTFTILPLGLDEGGHTGNDSRSLTIL
jgi:hypothetical protein